MALQHRQDAAAAFNKSAGVTTGGLVFSNMALLQHYLWRTACCLADSPAWKQEVANAVMPMFHFAWQQERPDLAHLKALNTCHNDADSYQQDFRHLAKAYLKYSAKPDAFAESPKARAMRLDQCTRFLGALILETKEQFKGDLSALPAGVGAWFRNACDGTQSGVAVFCNEWACALSQTSHQPLDTYTCFMADGNYAYSPTQAIAMCDLLEEVVRVQPDLIEGSENLFWLALAFNRAEALRVQQSLDNIARQDPIEVPSALLFPDSDDELEHEE